MSTPTRDPAAGHFRRYHGYDYSRGAALFLTFNVEPKEDILGNIEAPGILVHNEWGRLVDAKVGEIALRHLPLRVMSHVIMPNHAHMRVYLPPGVARPLVVLGDFVSAFKRSTSLLLQHRGSPGPLWEELYHALAEKPGARIVKAGHKMLGSVYRPTRAEPPLFPEGRLLLLSRQTDPGQSRRAGWLDLNADLAAMADRAVYARVEGGRLRW